MYISYLGCEIFSIVISRGYNEAAFKEDLKKLFLLLGVENKRLVFFLTQSQISEESMYTTLMKYNMYLCLIYHSFLMNYKINH